MGKVFALCGPSGAGKTTFLTALAASKPQRFRFLQRVTCRARRPNEEDFEYDFYSEDAFLQKVFAGDLIFPEVFDGAFYGIDRIPISDVLSSNDDGP
jgi:guanylate kinase